jgi:hypothetical protein
MIYIALSIDAKVAELVDALASGVSVLTDVRVQVPLFAPSWRRNINQSNNIDCAKVAELVDALASGVSVLTDVRVQVPLFAPIDDLFGGSFEKIPTH